MKMQNKKLLTNSLKEKGVCHLGGVISASRMGTLPKEPNLLI